MLSASEIKRRIHAARILRDVKQTDLQDALAVDGLGKTELGRIERGQLPLTKVRRRTLANALGVPEAWFLSENVDEIVGLVSPQRGDAVLPQPEGELARELSKDQPSVESPRDRERRASAENR